MSSLEAHKLRSMPTRQATKHNVKFGNNKGPSSASIARGKKSIPSAVHSHVSDADQISKNINHRLGHRSAAVKRSKSEIKQIGKRSKSGIKKVDEAEQKDAIIEPKMKSEPRSLQDEPEVEPVVDFPSDQKEPNSEDRIMEDNSQQKWCTCEKKSYGLMIACDNNTCKYQWFHFRCVGLTEKPEGIWYCFECIEAKKEAQHGDEASDGGDGVPEIEMGERVDQQEEIAELHMELETHPHDATIEDGTLVTGKQLDWAQDNVPNTSTIKVPKNTEQLRGFLSNSMNVVVQYIEQRNKEMERELAAKREELSAKITENSALKDEVQRLNAVIRTQTNENSTLTAQNRQLRGSLNEANRKKESIIKMLHDEDGLAQK